MFNIFKWFKKSPQPVEKGISLNYPTSTLGRIFDETASRFGDAPAISFSGVNLTYSELKERTNRLAGGLSTLGVKKGEKVLFTLPNCPEFTMAFIAVQKLGGVVVNAGPLMGVVDLKKLVKLTNPKVIIALDLQADALKEIATEQTDLHWLWISLRHYQNLWKKVGYTFKTMGSSIPKTQHQITFDELMKQSPSRPPSYPMSQDDTAVLQPTGGTTGILKVAELTHRNLIANAMQTSSWGRIKQGQERVLGILPMFHVYGLSTCIIMPVFNGGLILPMLRFKVDQLIDIILEHKPTTVPIVPAIVDAITKKLEADPKLKKRFIEALHPKDSPKGVVVITGAVPLHPNSFKKFKALTGIAIRQGYGLTESSPVTHLNSYDDPRPGVIGYPVADTVSRLVSVDDPTKDADGPGELLIRGPQVMKGYYKNPEETAKMFIEINGNKWLRTGDIATVDKDGIYRLVDRKKDMINRGGLKIWPQKVEAHLITHEKVVDVAVYGVDDEKLYQTVVASVVLAEDTPDDEGLAEELREFCRKNLAPYEVPSKIVFDKELPRSGLGKMLKYKLKQEEVGVG